MSGFDYPKTQASASRLIAKFGFPATITPASTGPATPWDTTPATPSTPVTVTVVDTGIKDIYAPGGLILRKARVLLIGAVGYTPKMADTITVRGVEHEIQVVHEVAPGGLALMFRVEVAA